MTTVTMDLRRETEAARSLLASYSAILADDDEATADAIEGETNLNEAMRDGIARLIELNAIIESAESTAKALKSRIERFKTQAGTIKAALGVALDIAGQRKYECDLGTLAIKAVPASVTIINETDIPAEFWIDQDPKLDKRLLLSALKAERDIPGAELSNGGSTVQLTVK